MLKKTSLILIKNELDLYIDIKIFVGESIVYLENVLAEFEEMIRVEYFERVENNIELFPHTDLFLIELGCRYNNKEIWDNDNLWEKALNEMISGEWSIGESSFVELPVQGFVLLIFYKKFLSTLTVIDEEAISFLLTVENLTRECLIYFGASMGDNGVSIKSEIDKVRKRRSIIDTKIKNEWVDMICWIEEQNKKNKYNGIKTRNALAVAIKKQFETDENYKGYNHSEKTIIRCLTQVYRIEANKPLLSPHFLERNINYEI